MAMKSYEQGLVVLKKKYGRQSLPVIDIYMSTGICQFKLKLF